MSFSIRKLWPLLLVAFLGACTSQKTKSELETQVKKEPAPAPISMRQQVEQRLIENPNLSDAQKAKLRALHDETNKKYTDIRTELRQTQSLLVKKLGDPNASIKEVTYLRKKMKTLGYKQTDVALSAVDKAAQIVGKATPMDEDFYQHFILTPDMQDPDTNVVPR